MEIWNGYRAGLEGAIEQYEADESFAIAQLDAEIIAKIVNKDTLYYRLGHQTEFDVRVAAWNQQADARHRQGNTAPAKIVQLDRLLDEMRLHKTESELELMQIASNISAEAHTRAMLS